jgi:hypothetical protein
MASLKSHMQLFNLIRMKFKMTIACILLSHALFSQVDSAVIYATPTTLEEYNYLTKGYKIQVESGLDMKKGYLIEKQDAHEIGDYFFTVMKLIREHGHELAGILIISEGKTTGKEFYSAIPINNAELMKLYGAEISKWDKGHISDYCQLISVYLSNYIHTAHLVNQKLKE